MMIADNVILLEGIATNWQNAISITSDALFANGFVKESFLGSCIEREMEYPTGINTTPPIAIPHTNPDHVIKSGICFLRLESPVIFKQIDSPKDDLQVKLIFNLALIDNSSQLEFLKIFADEIKNPEFLMACDSLPLDGLATYLASKNILNNNIEKK